MQATGHCRLLNGRLLHRKTWGVSASRPLLFQHHLRTARRQEPIVRASKNENVDKIKEEMEKAGLTKQMAQKVLEEWRQDVGHEVKPDDLRRVLTKSSQRFLGYLLLQMLLDAGAAYGAFVGGNLLGDAIETYGWPAVILQAVAFILAGYYATGVAIDLFRLGALAVGFQQFNVNAEAFLEAVQELAGSGRATGLSTLDKAKEAVNMVKVLGALMRISDLLQKEAPSSLSSMDMLRDLGAYLTLEKAERSFGFDPASVGLTEAQAADIAVVFSKYDLDDNGVLSFDEFKRLCGEFAPELNEAEVKAGFSLLDTNQDNQVEFKEFVAWWMKKLQLPATSGGGS